MSHTTDHSDACYNCGTMLTGPFCAACGQKVQELDPSLKHFLHDLTHELLHFDGKIYRSVWALLARPGVLTRDYFEGRRARWISPIRLYIVFSVVYIAIASLEGGIAERTFRSFGYLIVVLMPIFAWLVGLVTKPRRQYPQHLYFALHVHAAWFAAWALHEIVRWLLGLVLTNTRVVGAMTVPYVLAYAPLAYRKAYDESFLRSVLKIGLMLATYTIIVGAGLVAIAMWQR